MKIVYCANSICNPGGIEHVTITKANALADIEGNEVWIIVTDNKKKSISYVNPKVHIVDLDVNYFDPDWKGARTYFEKRRLHKKRLSESLNAILPDIVISTDLSEKTFLPSIKVKSHPVFIREIHFEKHYRKRMATGFSSKMIALLGEWYDYGFKIKDYDQIVILTQEDKECNWDNDRKIVVMPNPITKEHSCQSDNSNKLVIAAGRLTQQKNFSSLIRIWSLVGKKHPDWRLQIWGSGEQESLLVALINQYNLQAQVKLMGYTYDLIKEMEHASIYAMTSEFEGFPLVLVEAMSVGLPIVSYQCPTGPKDIITEGIDGFLIPMNEERQFAERVCWLIEHEEERKKMGKMAIQKSKDYSIEKIIDRWMHLFERLRNNKCV